MVKLELSRKMISDITIISVSFNSATVILDNWKDFLNTTQLQVFIIDNASSDQSDQVLSNAFPNLNVKRLGQNVGYGRAANEGIRLCKSRFALLLNPDLVVSEDVISQLFSLALADEDDTAIWAPAISEASYLCIKPQSTEAVSGAAMLFDLQKMKNVGFFDEKIFLYSEESDLCYRTRQAGYGIKLCPSVYLQHFGDSSSGENLALTFMKSWHFGWSRCYFYHKHALDFGKQDPLRMYRNYKLKSYLSWNKMSRLDYKAKSEGVKAFMEGEKAFRSDEVPQKFQI